MQQGAEKYRIRSVERALQVLLCFTQNRAALTSDEIGELVGLHKSTVYRILATLEASGFIERSPAGESYRLGAASLLLGTTALGQVDLPARARPHLQSLMHATGETVHLVVLHRNQGLVIDKIDSERSVRMASGIGFRSPLYCTGAGKVLLAHLPPANLEAFLAETELRTHTPHTITDPERLRRELVRAREQGFAMDKEEIEPGLRCVAAPIRDYSGGVIASVSISGPSSRMTSELLPQLCQTLVEHALRISNELGYRPVESEQELVAK
jgi:DNA-binding IclR family transcriptional regulator